MESHGNVFNIKMINTDVNRSNFDRYYSLTDNFGNYIPIKENDPVLKIIKKFKKEKNDKKLKKTISQELEEIFLEKSRKMSLPRKKGVLTSFVDKIDNLENLIDPNLTKDLKSDCVCILERMLKIYERKLGPENKLTLQVKQKLMSEKESLI